jgi:NADH dehydrogenase
MGGELKKNIVVVGAGFGGLSIVKALKKEDVSITIIDKTNHHVFQPLLYQVATAALAPGDIAVPIRGILSKQKNAHVVMGEVTGIDTASRIVTVSDGRTFPYDDLILAPGARHSYFGHDEWEALSPGLKTISDALTLREMMLTNFETAEQLDDQAAIPYLNFVVVGGGPTGVELAGAIAEITRRTMLTDFRRISPGMVHVYLIEAMPAVLSAYSSSLSEKARRSLESLGVNVLTHTRVEHIDATGVKTNNGFIASKSIIWAAGNQASPLIKLLNAETDRAGRAVVTSRLHLPDDDHVFVIGDAAHVAHANSIVPGVAQGAMQMGTYVAGLLKRRYAGKSEIDPFRYRDLGNMATIGRAKAIADIKGLEFHGTVAWLMWCVIHVAQLISFRNRFRVMAEWLWYYLTFKPGFRLITGLRRK